MSGLILCRPAETSTVMVGPLRAYGWFVVRVSPCRALGLAAAANTTMGKIPGTTNRERLRFTAVIACRFKTFT